MRRKRILSQKRPAAGGEARERASQTVDNVGAGIIPSTTFLYIALLLPKTLISSRIPIF